jgi:hypothetical protein
LRAIPSINVGKAFIDSLVKSLPNRHTGEGQYPEIPKNTGFRVKHGMTKRVILDFLRGRHTSPGKNDNGLCLSGDRPFSEPVGEKDG